jgi:D-beta-D-heptose 7-phosphate kinase/D-beta-D-heptose 1-phosphate adenosyltransferase
MNNKYLAIINRFSDLHILVIGDAMLDVYLEGAANRICREAPVPIVDIRNVNAMPGGAANTAMNLMQLGARVDYVSVVGRDHEAELLKGALTAQGLDISCIRCNHTRQTITKQRVTAGSQLLVRFDAGTTDAIDSELEQWVIDRLTEKFHEVDAVIVSDYGYGLMTRKVIETLKILQHKKQTILVIDAKSLDKYRHIGATVAKPNYQELLTLLAITEPAPSGHRSLQLKRYGPELLKKTGTTYVAATIDIEGALLFQHGKKPYRTFSKPVENTRAAGAGDTYISALTLALAGGASIEIAGDIAQSAAMVVLHKSATATCTQNELSHYFGNSSKYTADWQELNSRLDLFRKKGKRIVFTNGCFDLLHSGHVTYLKQARTLGDALVLGLNSDASIKRLKGNNRPANTLQERIRILSGLESVTFVTSFEDDTPVTLLDIIRPDVLVKGDGEYTLENLPEAPVVLSYGGKIEVNLMAGIHQQPTALSSLKV